ncbi:histone-lysine N-methyltransferase ATXR4 isoform X2 [Aristolochia californica]|uniref:histone-lysine N-methyltransferase ATXR4 isoform X2 n=1 Tax=Aristolochia californica TaxID=171875 RepID=UPI0035DB49E3
MYRTTSFGRRTSLKLRHLNVVFLRGRLSNTFSVPPEKSNSELTRSPPPIRVALTEFAGRGVFATRRIGSGDLIHTATPVVAHPSLSLLHKVCYFCLKQLGVNRNAAYIHAEPTGNTNQRVCFCNEDCRESSKVFHEVECLADWSVYDEYCRSRQLKYPLLLKRLACMVISGALLPDQLDILQPETLSPGKISAMQEGFDMLRSILTESSIDNEQMTFLTEQWYISMLARIRINAFRVELVSILYEDLLSSAAASVEAEAAVGNAVYMLPSFYNHDCDPNVHIIWTENVDARVKALRDIDEGEELRICYIDASIDRDARQAILLEGFGFRCNCFRCISGD